MKNRRLFNALIYVCIVTLWAMAAPAAIAGGPNIKNANYDPVANQVIVHGNIAGAGKGESLSLFDSATGQELDQSETNKKGKFKFHFQPLGVPCAVTVVAGGVSVSADVKHAPSDCSPTPLTLSGYIVDEPLPYAVVKVTVGGQTFTTVADENGFYTIDIVSSLIEDLLLIEATAAEPDANGTAITLTAIVGTFSKALSDEEQNVTNVTTANFILLVEANDDEIPANLTELSQAEKSVDATEVLELAAVIKLIIDDPNFSMPAGYDSLLDFVADQAAVDTFIAEVEASPNPDALTETMLEIVQDSNLTPGFDPDDIPARYYSVASAQPGYMARSGEVLELNPDGTGSFLSTDQDSNSVDAAFNWVVVDGQLVIDFPALSPAPFVSFITDDIYDTTATPQQIDAFNNCRAQGSINGLISVHALTYTLLNDGTLVDAAQQDSLQGIDYFGISLNTSLAGCELMPEYLELADKPLEIVSAAVNLRDSREITSEAFTPALVEGTWGTFYFYDPADTIFGGNGSGLNYDMQTFNVGGTMSARFNTEDINLDSWSIVDGKLVINYNDGSVQTVTILDTNPANPHEYGFFHEFDGGSGRGVVYNLAVKVDPSFTFVEGDLVNPAGYFWNGMINAWQARFWDSEGILDLGQYWGWKFDSLPAASHPYFYVWDWDGNGSLDRIWEVQSLTWALPVDGTLKLTYDSGYGPIRERHWIPLAADTAPGGERRMYMMEWEDQDGGRRINPRINMQMELMELQTPEDYDFLSTW